MRLYIVAYLSNNGDKGAVTATFLLFTRRHQYYQGATATMVTIQMAVIIDYQQRYVVYSG